VEVAAGWGGKRDEPVESDDPGVTFSLSDGMTLASALTNAQATYPNARVATPAELDDLFAAAGITYDGVLTASGSVTTGDDSVISSGANYDGGVLSVQLGFTDPGPSRSSGWTDPDWDNSPASTRDYLILQSNLAVIGQYSVAGVHLTLGWFFVSEAAVPEPSLLVLLFSGAVGLMGSRLVRKRRPTNPS
jgi:hypothetical protein